MKQYEQQMALALDWFHLGGVDQWNFACLLERSMIGGDRARGRDEIERSESWGWAQNLQGRNVYMRPARPGPWGVVFLDDLPPRVARGVAEKYAALVVESSAENCQVWIRTAKSLTEPERLQVQRALCVLAGADVGSVSGDHFGRAPGFANRKPGRGGWIVRVIAATHGAALDPTPHLDSDAEPSPPAPGGRARVLAFPHLPSARVSRPSGAGPQAPAPDGQREYAREYGWCLHVLRGARDCRQDVSATVRRLQCNLAAKALARGKRQTAEQAERYAQVVVSAAARYLGLL